MAAPIVRTFCWNSTKKLFKFRRACVEKCNSNYSISDNIKKRSIDYRGSLYTSKCYYSSESVIQKRKQENFNVVSIDKCENKDNDRHIVEFRKNIKVGPPLNHFIAQRTENGQIQIRSRSAETGLEEISPYLSPSELLGNGRKVYFEVYGCQMNVNDTEIAWAILQKAGYERTSEITEADVILVMTCSIREGAEQKIWNHLKFLKSLKKRKIKKEPSIKIGILGCMAERLKTKILDEEKAVDLVAGPDSYKDLPAMLAITNDSQAAVNVMLSMDETYADIMPVQRNKSSPSAYVSIMRGCDNMCSYCIVPFTRGRERSRPISSIKEEIRILSDQGVKEVTLLGQNVNSYRDMSEASYGVGSAPTKLADGFQTIYKSKVGGRRFADLLDTISDIDPEMRIRFTSPHPKDFPDEVLYLIRDKHNICNQLHMPAQSGNNQVLDAMRRGYTREAYVNLVHKVKSYLPGVALSSDFICGFCGETEEAHLDTLSLIREVKYNTAFVFTYSLRQKTHAHRKLVDDVSLDIKKRRVSEAIVSYREEAEKLNRSVIGWEQLILIDGKSKRSDDFLAGRNDGFIKVIVPNVQLSSRNMSPGDYVVVKITDASSQVLKGVPLYHTTLKEYSSKRSESRAL